MMVLAVGADVAPAQPAPEKAGKKARARKVQEAPARPVLAAGALLDAQALTQRIDQAIQARLDAEGIKPCPPADDAEFLRRAYLDLVGVIPPPERVVAFLGSPNPNKRAVLIDELLAEPRHGWSLAEIWTEALVPRDSKNRRLSSGPLQAWLAQAFNTNRPWNETVYDLLTASGTQADNGAVTFFLGNATADKLTDTVSRMFLGVQLQCAQCHDHPFTGWKRQEYWGMAAFFTKVRASARVDQLLKKGKSPAIGEDDNPRAKKAALPESALRVPPKFLLGEQPPLPEGAPYRPILARWLTAADNPFFARAMVNRTWAHFFGRGLVNPVDDMHDGNPPSHPELLASLSEQFKASGFNVRHLIRAICNSQAYQRTSRPAGAKEGDAELLSHLPVRVLSPRQLYDSLSAVLESPLKEGSVPGKKGPVNKAPGNPREQFLSFFNVGDGANPLEYQVGIPQALRLMNAPQINRAAVAIHRAALAGNGTPAAVIEQLYLTTLARRPTAAERQRLTRYIRAQADPFTGYGDILWALLNSTEFAVNH
jgi:hypothetical protein